MSQNDQETKYYSRLKQIIDLSSQDLLERDETIRLSLLAIASGESVFLLGPPGGAKSLLARRLTALFKEGRYFEYLMGRFSTPEEIFGPIDITKLKDQGIYERNIDGYLPNADLVFLDEIWKASPPIQNSLLTALEERKFKNGTEVLELPLKSVIAASNTVGESSETRAFWDRFLLRLVVAPIEKKKNFLELIHQNSSLQIETLENEKKISNEEWNKWQSEADARTFSPQIDSIFWHIRKSLGKEHHFSDRRWKKLARLLKFSALFHDRQDVSVLDCFIIPHCLWNNVDDISHISDTCFQIIRDRGYENLINIDESQIRLEKLEKSLGINTTETNPFKPKLFESEYFEVTQPIDGMKARIWQEDWHGLEKDHSHEVELFLYDQNGLHGTLSKELILSDRADSFLIGSDEYSLIGTFIDGQGQDQVLTGDQRKKEQNELEALIAEYLTKLKKVQIQELELAKNHLFVSIEETDPVFSTIEDQIQIIMDLQKRLQRIVSNNQ